MLTLWVHVWMITRRMRNVIKRSVWGRLAQLVSVLGQWSKGPWFETRIGQWPYFESHYHQLVRWCQYMWPVAPNMLGVCGRNAITINHTINPTSVQFEGSMAQSTRGLEVQSIRKHVDYLCTSDHVPYTSLRSMTWCSLWEFKVIWNISLL
jgi:hypothetical protein